MNRLVLGACFAALATFPVLAQHNHGTPQQQTPARPGPQSAPSGHGAMHGHHGMHGQRASKPSDPSSEAYTAASAKMHKAMAIAFTGNADSDFVRGMIPHHQGAIDMAEIVLKHGQDEAVRKLANEVIAAQRKEIADMQAWLQRNPNPTALASAKQVIEAYEEVNEQMHADMDIPLTGNADADFMKGMIPHHEGAVEMAKVLLRYGQDPELRKLAESIIKSQTDEILMMIGWLRAKGL